MKGMPITRGGRADFLLQHTSACVLHIDMHACALIKSFVHSFARLLETNADYPARLKDLALSRRAARAVATEATSHASPAGWSTTENMAFICTSSAVTQQDADAAYYDVAALSSWALKSDGEKILAALQCRFALLRKRLWCPLMSSSSWSCS